MKIRRLLAGVLCLMMLCGMLAGCGGNGTDGKDGITPSIGANGNWWIGETDTGVKATGSDGVGIEEIETEIVTDPATGETYVNFTYEMSDKTVKTVKVPLAQNGQSGEGAYLVPQPVDADYYAGKRFVFLGDSITCGVGASSKDNYYVTRLAKLLGTENYSNVAVSGTTMSKGGEPHVNDSFWKLTEANCAGADVVTIMLGTNDFGTAVKDGKLYGQQKYDDNRDAREMGEFLSDDNTTIYGAVKMWCEKIMELKQTNSCKNTKFFFATPAPLTRNMSMNSGYGADQNAQNIHGIKLRNICEAIIETCAYYKIPVLDVNLYCGIYYKNSSDHNVSKNMVQDGIHPNDAGHKLIAESFYKLLLANPTYVGQDEALQYVLSGRDAYAEMGLTAAPVPTITYQTSMGTAPKAVDARRLPVVMPILADQGSFTFGGWYLDKACTKPATPGDVICSDITLYAAWN